jgi:hypothetical protein
MTTGGKMPGARVLDLRVGEEPPYELAVFPASLERQERDRHVVERVGKTRARLVHDARRFPAEIPLRANHRAHARAAERIDRDVQLVERAQHADMSEPAREAAAQREPDRRSGEEARHACDIAGTPEPHVQVALERAPAEPLRRARRRGHGVAVHEDERHARSPRAIVFQPCAFNRARRRILRRVRQDHDAVRLT